MNNEKQKSTNTDSNSATVAGYMENRRTKYVVGFAFNEFETFVALILKARPNWQKGKFNGIGGHIEEGETPEQAMNREWMEETQADEVNWTLFCKLIGEEYEVYFYRGNTEIDHLESFSEGETIWRLPVDELPKNIIPNLNWLIPMAQLTSIHDYPYLIEERAGFSI